MMHRVFWALLAWVAGVALQLQQVALWPGAVYAAMLALSLVLGLAWAALARRWRGHERGQLGWTLLAVLVGCLAGTGWAGWRAVQQADPALPLAWQGQDLQLVGTVASLPQRHARAEVFEFEIESAQHQSQPVPLPRRVLLSWYHQGYVPDEPAESTTPTRLAGPGLRAGERWRLTVRLRSPHGLANPHGQDRERWLWENGLAATGTVRLGLRAPAPQNLGPSGQHRLDAARQWTRERIDAQVSDPRTAGVLAALVLGDQSAIEADDWALFRTTGVAHLMSISGLHITGFAWLAMLVIRRLWRHLAQPWPMLLLACPAPVAAALGGVGLAAAYAVFSGWGVPAQRTVLMLACVLGLRTLACRWPWPLVWLLVMALVLAVDPWAWLQPGFWLSFVAVGILFASDAGAKPVSADRLPEASALRRAGGALARLLREQALMTVALAPLTLLLFGQFSVVGLLANLLAVPVVTLLITPLAMLGVLWSALWTLAAGAVQVLSMVLQLLSHWPWAALERPQAPTVLALLAVLGGVLCVLRLPWLLRGAGVLLLWPVLVWVPPRPAPGQFELLALDVGQGSAVLVRTAHHSLLFDTGPRYSPGSDAGQRVVVPVLRALGEVPNTVIVSHRDSDHAGGMAAVRQAWPQARWLASFDTDPAHGLTQRCVAGRRWHWDGVDFEVLHPQPTHYSPDGQGLLSSNAMSCVLHIRNAQHSAWLGGDLDADHETQLALARPDLRATVMLAPHHGSKTSSSPVLLNTLQPRWVLVQSGYRNAFGHPAPVVLDRLRQRGIAWVDSPSCGAATWRSDDPAQVQCHRAQQRRYWHHPAPAYPVNGADAAQTPLQ